MPRQKNDYVSDGSDSDASQLDGSDGGFDSQDDEASRAEKALFEYNGRKRRKVGRGSGKATAWEGIFGEEEDEHRGGRGLGSKRGGGGGGSSGRTDWTRVPSFIPKAAATTDDQVAKPPVEIVKEEREDDEESSEEESGSEHSIANRSPRVRDEEEDNSLPPVLGEGIGLPQPKRSPEKDPEDTASITNERSGGRGGIGSSKRGSGIGQSGRPAPQAIPSFASASAADELKGGIGSGEAPQNPFEGSVPDIEMPSTFGERRQAVLSANENSRAQRSFMGRAAPTSTAIPTPLTAIEAARFRGMAGSFGARMLANLGWNAGEGLGTNKEGRAIPVEAGKMMGGGGIRSGIRTEDSKREAKRKGEKVSDDEDEQPTRRGRKSGPSRAPADPEQSWKRQRKVRVKVEHKTYEQLLAEAGDSATVGVGLVLDARGGDLKEVHSLSALSLSNWTPSGDATQLPELRHNLRLIVDVSKADVDALAHDGVSLIARRRWAAREEELAQRTIDETSRQISRIERIQGIIGVISGLAIKLASAPHPSLQLLTEPIETLLDDFLHEYNALSLDDVVVAAIGQILRSPFLEWQPFDGSSDALLSSLKPWRRAFRLSHTNDSGRALVTNDTAAGDIRQSLQVGRSMTAWESLLHTLWLPKVRSSINNEWDARNPQAAVQLLEAWDPLLPSFIRDNILDQLILPKVVVAVDEWRPRPSLSGKKRSLGRIVFPWLPMLGDRMETVLDIAKRRIKQVLRDWVPEDGVPEEFSRWRRDIYTSKEWDKLLLDYVVPKLGATLRALEIDAKNQQMVPLENWVLPWHTLIRPSTFSSLIENNFFQKWLDALYVWLIAPKCLPNEVAEWFVWWKSRFPEQVITMDGIAHGFSQGLNLMNEAMQLGINTPARLRKPVYQTLSVKRSAAKSTHRSLAPKHTIPDEPGITFRFIAEDFAAQHDLLFLPAGRSHDKTGKPLFKVTKNVDGRGGATVYVGDNAVYVQAEDGAFKAVSVQDMVQKALA